MALSRIGDSYCYTQREKTTREIRKVETPTGEDEGGREFSDRKKAWSSSAVFPLRVMGFLFRGISLSGQMGGICTVLYFLYLFLYVDTGQ